MIETPREMAVRLLRDNSTSIGEGIYKLACKLQPRWANVDRTAFVHNSVALIGGVADFMAGGDTDFIFRFARDAIHVRKLGGYSGVDFNIVVHAYMPIIRKAFLSRAPSLREGIAAYDAAESIVLPLITRLVEAIARADEITTPDAQPPFHGRPFEAISVAEQVPEFMRDVAPSDEGSDEEPTLPRARQPLRR